MSGPTASITSATSTTSTALGNVRAVLFDLDGTLIDSAPDLAGAGNDMRVARGLTEHPLSHFRPMVGSGARGMLGRALGVTPSDPEFGELRDEFLQRYEGRMTRETALFEGMEPVLAAFEKRGLPWGIVTNKATRFADPLARALGLVPRAATLVCGDTTAHSKPCVTNLLRQAKVTDRPKAAGRTILTVELCAR